MIIFRSKIFSENFDSLYDLTRLNKYCGTWPKFVKDYIKNIQQKLKGNQGVCIYCIPVVHMPNDFEDGELSQDYNYFFSSNIDDGLELPLAYKDGKWYEKRGFFTKKYIPVPDPAEWIYRMIMEFGGENEEENSKSIDYKEFKEILNQLHSMFGKYKSI